MNYSNLKAIIDRSQRTALFSGAGTFTAKDTIKSLGTAKWLAAQKQWEISSFSTSTEELLILFPEIVIEENKATEKPPQDLSFQDAKIEMRGNDKIPTGISVGALIGKVKSIIQNAFPNSIYVYGVISSIKLRGDQAFIELVEQGKPTEKLHCVIWDKLDLQLKGIREAGFELEADLQVMFEVKVGLNARSGSLSLTVLRIVAEYTIAKLAAERDVTNAKLKEEGLFSKNKEQKLPFLPKRLGILTSSGGTVINDFRAALDVSNFGFELFWLSVSVQGSEAKRQIINGIKALENLDQLDAILIFRGGGSKTELAIFNDYEVAKTVCLCKKPIVSAIGHQEDQSSVQDVSCLSFGVPKDIGRFFSDIIVNYRETVSQSIQNIKTLGLRQIAVAQKELTLHCRALHKISDNLLKRSATDIEAMLQQLAAHGRSFTSYQNNQLARSAELIQDRCSRVLERASEKVLVAAQYKQLTARLIEMAQLKLKNHEELLQQISPEVQMKRGFTLLRSKENSYIISANKVSTGENVEILFFDGARDATIGEQIQKTKEII